MTENNSSRVATITPESPHESPPRYPAEPEVPRPGFAVHDDWFSISGKRHAPGLYWHDWGKGDDPEPVDTWICTPIHAVALTGDENDNSAGLLLRFLNHRGRWREWSMPLHLLKGSGEELRGELLDMGARINPRQQRRLAEWLMQQHPSRWITAAIRTGWHDLEATGRVFVMPGRTIGSDDVRFQSEHPRHDDFRQGGTPEEWCETVARPCSGNPVLLLAVSAAFAGPLLKVARLQEAGGAGLHLVGDSSKGKTTALSAAGSVWGAPGFVRTWRATANGLEATAAALNDTALILDEISECDPREIGAIVYALANGQGKQRARREGGAPQAASWRLMALSTGERSLAAHMSEGGRRTKAGQHARLLDVPATDRAHGAFDHLHDHADGRAFADALKQAAGRCYGHAGPTFVEYLQEQGKDWPKLYAETEGHPWFQANGELAGRAASTFALVGMAGELATEAGLTGWTDGEALKAAAEAFARWADLQGEGNTEDQQILEGIRDFLDRYGDTRFSSLQAPEAVRGTDRAGYWRDGESGRVWLFSSSALKEAAPGFEPRRIADALERTGWLAGADTGKRSKRVKVNGRTTVLYAVQPQEG